MVSLLSTARQANLKKHQFTDKNPYGITRNSQRSAIICPLKQCLALTRTARSLTASAVFDELRNMPPHRSPPGNLPRIVFVSPTTIVATIPLKPPTRIIRMNPVFLPPDRERLTRINAKVVQLRIALTGRKLRPLKP